MTEQVHRTTCELSSCEVGAAAALCMAGQLDCSLEVVVATIGLRFQASIEYGG